MKRVIKLNQKQLRKLVSEAGRNALGYGIPEDSWGREVDVNNEIRLEWIKGIDAYVNKLDGLERKFPQAAGQVREAMVALERLSAALGHV